MARRREGHARRGRAGAPPVGGGGVPRVGPPVVVSFAPERLDELRAAVHAVGKRLGQEAMYVRFEAPRVELIAVRAVAGGEG